MNLRPATIDDCWSLAPRLRSQDLQEIAHGSGLGALDAVVGAWKNSHFREAICTDDGLVVAIWGVTSTPQEGLGSIWMLGSPEIELVSLPFLRACEPRVRAQHERYRFLACASWRGNHTHHHWLRWLRFKEAERHGEFIVFVRHV
jgi:hypothetical protein